MKHFASIATLVATLALAPAAFAGGGVHLDWPAKLQRGFAGLFAKHIQNGLRHVGHIQTTANQSPHHEQIDAQPVSASFGALF